ncbi:hypothetical protein EXU57_18395 [Segetibacter sp. 3557_3]|uniref:hypothetical protein n=1 Tax=Segetibacter sp. 3557_3 TaxID=2547429 RepID=UPI001058BD66|nr:hypothetical protein [Segetibacter sp. 3557_3]TDH23030.1 hypothetical protein EXU57_18395 [Segetibacter sp. 3557_3]
MNKLFLVVIAIILSGTSIGQRVIYSEPDKDDLKQTRFEIVGKIGSNILIYKELRDNHSMSIYDASMKQIERLKLDFLPDKLINTDFIAYPDFCYMFYQYQKRNVVYCMAAKLDGNGKKIGDPIQLDTTQITFFASNKLYSVIHSDDKQQIQIFKINNKNDRNHLLTTSLFNKELALQYKHYMSIPMPDRNDILTEFYVDNDGNLVFTRAVQTGQSDNIQKLFFMTKERASDQYVEREIKLNNHYLDDVRIKVDNYNKRYIITSLYSKSRQGNIDGLHVSIWDRPSSSLNVSKGIPFDENLRNEAKGQNGMRTAFNDYFLRNLIVTKDGGFLLAAESFYTTGRAGNFNRWGSPFGSPFLRGMNYYSFTPYYYAYPWSSWNNYGYNQYNRYHAENVVVFSFDSSAKMNWSNVIIKDQYDDDVDLFIGYQLVNTGDQLHFLFNKQEKRLQLLSDQSISPEGQLTRVPTLKNLDKGFDFMPRLGKQISNRQIVFPCMYRNYLCFAKLEL